MTRRCVIYARVSSAGQAGDERYSLPEQLRLLRELADQQELDVIEEFSEVGSASKKGRTREGFARLLSLATSGEVEVLLATEDTRFSRNMLDNYDLIQAKEENPKLELRVLEGRLPWSDLESDGGKEIRKMKKRMDRGQHARLRQGKMPPGPARFGYKKDAEGFPEIHPEHAEHVQLMFRLYADGASPKAIFAALQASGSKRKWTRTSMQRVTQDSVYAEGLHEYKRGGQLYPVTFPKLIDRALWLAAQDRLERNRTRHRGHNLKIRSLVAGMVYCAAHGTVMTATDRKDGRPSYRCSYENNHMDAPKSPDCGKSIIIEELDGKIWTDLFEIVTNVPRLMEEVEAAAARLEGLAKEGVGDTVKKLTKQSDQLESERQMVIRGFRQGAMSTDDLAFQLDELTINQLATASRLEEAKAMLKVQMQPEEIRSAAEKLVLSKDWRAVSKGGYTPLYENLEEQQALVKKFLRNVEVSTVGNLKSVKPNWSIVLPLPALSAEYLPKDEPAGGLHISGLVSTQP